MGRKWTRTGKFICLCITGLISLSLSGCPLLQPKKTIEFSKADVQKDQPLNPLSESLLLAKRLLEQKDYEGALKENLKVLTLAGANPPGDNALFNMGLIYAHHGNPKKDYGKSLGFFKKLATDYPQSPLTEETRIWIGMIQENERLSQAFQKCNQTLEQSKKVDIEIEEKKREKAK